jgi:flagellum-specific ATP synthase
MRHLAGQLEAAESAMSYRVIGQIQAIGGLTIEATDLALPVGSLCSIESFGGRKTVAEVIGFQQDRTLLMSLGTTSGIGRGDRVENITAAPTINCTDHMLGRVLDGFARAIDGKGALPMGQFRRIDARGAKPLSRRNIDEPIATSVRAGKSTLIAQIAKHTSAEVSVVALIGERGREVQEFIQRSLGEEGMKRCVVIVSTSDDAPLLRVRAAKTASTISEYFRDQGKNVLLLMDSLTRLCQAQRQIGLSAKEPPATKGYPPSVFALLPEILERAGRTEKGSITGFYTVLVEGDDFNEPIPDAIKGIGDGHIWLSRSLANRGHFPAIDVLQSISRVSKDVVPDEQTRRARRLLSLTAAYQDIEDIYNIGAYVQGANLEVDLAVQSRPKIVQFLRQSSDAPQTLEQSSKMLGDLNAWIDQLDKALKSPPKRAAAVAPAPAAAK